MIDDVDLDEGVGFWGRLEGRVIDFCDELDFRNNGGVVVIVKDRNGGVIFIVVSCYYRLFFVGLLV